VNEIAKLLKVTDINARFLFKNNPLVVSKRAVKHPFPTPCTIGDAIKKYVDLRGTLRKKLLTDLAPYCTDDAEKQR
jgi:sulfite reductase alpha subunit-like flavoprotein